MASKLYAPILDSVLPAQGGSTLKIPFQHNQLVQPTNTMRFKIKNITTNTVILEQAVNVINGSNILQYSVSSLTAGEYYKIQIAYQSTDGTIGYYSDTGIFKYLGSSQPTIDLSYSLSGNVIDLSQPIILNNFTCASDTTEKELSYKIDLLLNDKIAYTSGELLHNPEKDYDEYYFNDIALQGNQTLAIQATILTNNLYEIIINETIGVVVYSIPTIGNSSITTTLNIEDGLVNIAYRSSPTGQVLRWCWEDNKWTNLGDASNVSVDRSVEQGKTYSYRLESDTYVSQKIMIDFEDIFLSDKNKQLAIRYNPTINNFKEIVNDTQINTLGSKYPFIIRNGNIKYKEFQIGGLIMSAMDENNLFFNSDTSHDNSIEWNTYEAEQEYEERIFKLEVLKWLNNGEVKLLRTGREGNYLVRLTDVSLTPEPVSGRLFHGFNCTAIEIADYTNSNLKKYVFPEINDYSNPFLVLDGSGSGSNYVPFEVLI